MFRTYQIQLDTNGNGFISFSPFVESVEWDVYQISIQTGINTANCTARIFHNGFFLCASAAGSLDSADGPPDVVVMPNEMLRVQWYNGTSGDVATAGVWYNENPKGTTYSSAH